MYVHNRGSRWIVRVFQTTCLMKSLLSNNERRSWPLWFLPPRIRVFPRTRVELSSGLTKPCRDRTNEVEEGGPNSNATNECVAEEGFSRTPPAEEAQPDSQTDMEQDLTYVGGMGYARPRGLGTTRGPTRVCAYGKHKKVRPPMLNAGEHRQEASRVRSMTGSLASSQRSSVYKAALLDAQAEIQRALAGLASTRAECNE